MNSGYLMTCSVLLFCRTVCQMEKERGCGWAFPKAVVLDSFQAVGSRALRPGMLRALGWPLVPANPL